MLECSICMSTIKNSCIGSCNHHFCYSCLLKWITIKQTKDNTSASCPKCRTLINEIRMDPEFDLLIFNINNCENSIGKIDYFEKNDSTEFSNDSNQDSVNSDNSYNSKEDLIEWKIEKVIVINFKIEEHTIFFELENNKMGPGVIIVNIQDEYIFKKYGIKQYDTILFINNIQCLTHENTTRLISRLMENKSIMKLSILPKISSKKRRLYERFYDTFIKRIVNRS